MSSTTSLLKSNSSAARSMDSPGCHNSTTAAIGVFVAALIGLPKANRGSMITSARSGYCPKRNCEGFQPRPT